MTNKTVFCEECREDVGYYVVKTPMIGTLLGVPYHYDGKEAKCARCGAYVDIDEICEYNLKALYEKFSQETGITPKNVM